MRLYSIITLVLIAFKVSEPVQGRIKPYTAAPEPASGLFFQQQIVTQTTKNTQGYYFPPDPFLSTVYYSGFVDVARNGGKMFYWYFPYKNGTVSYAENVAPPLVLWLTGGPGCSSSMAALTENGPLNVEPDDNVVVNSYSWTNVADMVYVDQPLGTGFSTVGDPRNLVTNETTVTQDMRQFLLHFIERFPSFKNRPFFITGESYAGHYIPSIALSLLENPLPELPLKGIAVGNGWVDPISQYPAYATYALEMHLISDVGYQLAVRALEACVNLIQRGMWPVALLQCNTVVTGILGKRNPYDIRLNCDCPPLCYNITSITDFMNDPVVQRRLGVHHAWHECNTLVYALMLKDWGTEVRTKVGKILDTGIPVLIYSGDQDFICNWRGGEAWVMRTEWSHANEFRTAPYHTWVVDGIALGEQKSFGNLKFLRVWSAGHMVPMDAPHAALAMIKEFLGGQQSLASSDFRLSGSEMFVAMY